MTSVPPGPLVVPCCGTFPELPALAEQHPRREIVGIDLSAGHGAPGAGAGGRAALARVMQGDAATLDARLARRS